MKLIRVGVRRQREGRSAWEEILNYPYGRFFVRTNSMIAPDPEVYFEDETFIYGYIDLYVEDRYAQMTIDRMESGLIYGRIVEEVEA